MCKIKRKIYNYSKIHCNVRWDISIYFTTFTVHIKANLLKKTKKLLKTNDKYSNKKHDALKTKQHRTEQNRKKQNKTKQKMI